MRIDEDLEPHVLPRPAPITDWRSAWSAFRTPHRRLEALLVAIGVAVMYLLCLAFADAVAVAANALVIKPVLKAMLGLTPRSALAQFVEDETVGAVVGVPVFFGTVWLTLRGLIRVQPVIDRWLEEDHGA